MKKFPEPASIAKKVVPVDANKIQQYLNIKEKGTNTYVDPKVAMELDGVLEKLGLQKGLKSFFSNEKEKISYLQSVVDQFNDLENKGSIITGKSSVKPTRGRK
jgi:hypothetical protein